MVCYITVSVRITDKIEDIDALLESLKAKGILFEEVREFVKIYGNIVINKKRKVITYSESDKKLVNKIKQDYAAAKLTKMARTRNYNVIKKKVGEKIQLVLRRY